MGFAQKIWDFQKDQFEFESALEEAGLEQGKHYSRIGWDDYDCSIEFYNVENDVRFGVELQKIVADAGFIKAYVNHKDGWETHYTWKTPFSPVRGWRRWMEHNKEPSPSGVTTLKKLKVSYWPEGWGKGNSMMGEVEIVPDPLEPKI